MVEKSRKITVKKSSKEERNVKKNPSIKIKKISKKKSISSVLKSQVALAKPEKEAVSYLKRLSGRFKVVMNHELKNGGYNADVFIGGSFAKGTLVKKKNYDVDIYVRFDWKYDKISDILNGVLKKVCKELDLKLEMVHGSRDYFHCFTKDKKYYLEIVPVTKIKHIHEERNVTDLSYFHVPYVKRKIMGLQNQVFLAKTFLYAQKLYGAETYIQGFSGYGVECLIIYYKSFLKMLKELVKVKRGERLVIDIEKAYKRKNDVFIEMNESRLHAPIVLVDPVYKERNALAALSSETFEKFQSIAKAFLKNPDGKFFVEEEIDISKLEKSAKRRKAEFLHLRLETDRQEGDIAGTKLKKFSDFLGNEIGRYFFVLDKEFEYDDKQHADFYLTLKSRKEVVRIGPPLVRDRKMRKHIRAFKQEHMKTYEKNGYLHSKIKIKFGAKEYVDSWLVSNKKKIDAMTIVGVKVV